MDLVRYGELGAEKPGSIDDTGILRDVVEMGVGKLGTQRHTVVAWTAE